MGVNCSCFSIVKALGGARLAEKFTEQFRPFFIIMKRLVLSLFALVCATVSFAQQNLVATLTHGDEVSMFYGADAYREAMWKAVHGDVINLSGGAFQAGTIYKALTIRGAGADVEEPTIIVNDFNINISSTTSQRLTLEGVRIANTITVVDTLKDAYFLNCRISAFQPDNKNPVINNGVFVNCVVDDMNFRTHWGEFSSMQFLNSQILCYGPYSSSTPPKSTFINCLIKPEYISNMYCCNVLNSVLISFNENNPSYPSSSSATNSLLISNKNPFTNALSCVNNKVVPDYSVFVDSDYTKDLTDEAKALYIGTDGTQVGIYGGPMPFSLTPTYPQITKMEVAPKTTADGKLSVNIEVSAAQ